MPLMLRALHWLAQRTAYNPGTAASARHSCRYTESRSQQCTAHAQVIRSNDVMYKAGQTEMVILRKLSGADPAGKRHCVRMLRSFEYRQHLCLVFESMVRVSLSLNLCQNFAAWVAVLIATPHPSSGFPCSWVLDS